MKNKEGAVTGPDGLPYKPATNRELDEICLAAFSRGAGKQALAYLRSITIELIGGPQISTEELRHREGARYLVGVIEARMNAARKQREAK